MSLNKVMLIRLKLESKGSRRGIIKRNSEFLPISCSSSFPRLRSLISKGLNGFSDIITRDVLLGAGIILTTMPHLLLI